MKTRYQKFVNHLLSFLQQGISPEKLALGLAFGVTLGIIPLMGATTLLCFLAALAFRLNIPFVQLVHYVISPLQIILYIPFLRWGTDIFSKQHFHYTFEQIRHMIANNLWDAIRTLFYMNMYGLLLWLLIAPSLFALSYFGGLFFIRKVSHKFNKK